jgi:GNAT superfamily N-acetyltransferase
VIRPATRDDAEEIVATVAEGFEGYRDFAPPGWEPNLDGETAMLCERLESPLVWCAIAERDGAVAGHAAFLPASMSGHSGPPDPGLAHLWNLFVRRPWWGTGLAVELLDAAVAEAAERGFERMRLYTPAAHARARRFYEREGWEPAGPPFPSPGFGMTLVEYARPLPTRRLRGARA